jgi:hypothetical protein
MPDPADIKRQVIDAAAACDTETVKRLTMHTPRYRWHALGIAARLADRPTMNFLLPFFGPEKMDLLLLAVCRPSERRTAAADPAGCADLLFQRDADPNVRDPDGLTAFMHGCISGNVELVRLFRRKHVTMDLFSFAAMGRADRIEQHLNAHPKAALSKDKSGWSALHCAAASALGAREPRIAEGLARVSQLLIEHGADIHRALKTILGRQRVYLSPLAMAASAGNTAVADILIRHGADPGGDWQAFHAALWNSRFDMAVKLHENGMDLDGHGNPFLHFLVMSNRLDGVRWLLARGASVNALDEKQRSALYRLCGTKDADLRMARLLISFDADPRLHPRGKPDSIELAAATGNGKIAQFLRQTAQATTKQS